MAKLYDNFAPERFILLCNQLAIAQQVVGFRQVDDGLRGVAHHQHHHNPCQQPGHGTISPIRKVGFNISYIMTCSPFKGSYVVMSLGGCVHCLDDSPIKKCKGK